LIQKVKGQGYTARMYPSALSCAFNAVFGKVGRIASPDVVGLVQLVKTKCLPILCMVLRYVLSIKLILDLFSMLWITVFVRYSTLN